MAITYGTTSYRGKEFNEYYKDVIFANNTLRRRMVRFIEDLKNLATLHTITGDVTVQAYTSARPTPVGNVTLGDVLISPVKATVYDTLDPEEVYRKSWIANRLPQGVQNIESNEDSQMILAYMIDRLARVQERLFWGGFTAATKAAITLPANASLTTASEKTYAAARANALVDGIISKLIIETLTVSGAPSAVAVIPVAGTTLDATNIKAELDKIYTAIPDELIYVNGQASGTPDETAIFMDYSVRKLIDQFNSNQLYRGDLIKNEGDAYSYQNVPIEFVPMPTVNTATAGRKNEYIWGTDVSGEFVGAVEFGPLEAFSYIQGFRMDFAIAAAAQVANQKVLYF
jgi:hypothetical protein